MASAAVPGHTLCGLGHVEKGHISYDSLFYLLSWQKPEPTS